MVCPDFGMSVFRFVDVLVVDVSVCRRFDQLPTNGSSLTHQILFINMVIILQTTYQNWFLQWHFSLSRSSWILLLKYNLHFTLHRLYNVNIFFQHSNILTRASHHWCLASNIVLVVIYRSWLHGLYELHAPRCNVTRKTIKLNHSLTHSLEFGYCTSSTMHTITVTS